MKLQPFIILLICNAACAHLDDYRIYAKEIRDVTLFTSPFFRVLYSADYTV